MSGLRKKVLNVLFIGISFSRISAITSDSSIASGTDIRENIAVFLAAS
jgi:hypothetical protein